MRHHIRHAIRLLLLLATLAASVPACGPRVEGGGERPARVRQDLIDAEEIRRSGHSNAHDLISAARPRWLIGRGSDTIMGEPTVVQVVLDGVPLGGPQALRDVNTMGIRFIQFLDGRTASARWGMGYGQGAIYISTRP